MSRTPYLSVASGFEPDWAPLPGTFQKSWSRSQESNLQPHTYKERALPVELDRRVHLAPPTLHEAGQAEFRCDVSCARGDVFVTAAAATGRNGLYSALAHLLAYALDRGVRRRRSIDDAEFWHVDQDEPVCKAVSSSVPESTYR